jgi:hypothetical protein
LWTGISGSILARAGLKAIAGFHILLPGIVKAPRHRGSMAPGDSIIRRWQPVRDFVESGLRESISRIAPPAFVKSAQARIRNVPDRRTGGRHRACTGPTVLCVRKGTGTSLPAVQIMQNVMSPGIRTMPGQIIRNITSRGSRNRPVQITEVRQSTRTVLDQNIGTRLRAT